MKLPAGLRITFMVHFIISAIVGIQHLLAPRIWIDLAGMEIDETVTWRLIGAAVIAFGVSSFLCYRARVWERVRIVVIMEIVWSFLGAMVILWALLFKGLAKLEWLNVVILMAFAIIFSLWHYKMNKYSADK